MDIRSSDFTRPVLEHQGTTTVWWLVPPREMREETLGGHLELISEFEIRAGGEVNTHHHPTYEFYFMLSGRALMTIEDETREIGPGDLVVMLSDLFDEGAIDVATRLAAARREVLAIQILTAEERDFPFQGGHRFRDPETGEELLGDGAAMRSEFLARFTQARSALHARLDAAGIRHAEYVLDQALDLPLRRLFGARDAAEYA